MTARVLKGSKQEIARQVADLEGEFLAAICQHFFFPTGGGDSLLAASDAACQSDRAHAASRASAVNGSSRGWR
jgi:hypothetical protein